MDQSQLDEVRGLFASLTSDLEDAAGLAAEGQSHEIDAAACLELVRGIRLTLRRTLDALRAIEALVAQS